MSTSNLADFVSQYRSAGLTPIPLHAYNGGACSCRQQGSCGSAGKHPRVNFQSALEATDQTWEGWLARWPDMNVGLLTGSRTGIAVLDIDPRHGGDTSLHSILESHAMPTTASAVTGGGGRHYFFKLPAGVRVHNSAGAESGNSGIAPGIDIRGEGGLIVVAPSRTQGEYTWC